MSLFPRPSGKKKAKNVRTNTNLYTLHVSTEIHQLIPVYVCIHAMRVDWQGLISLYRY